MLKSRPVLFVCAAIAILAAVASIEAVGVAPKNNFLTFKTSVALPGVTLPAGVYTFEAPPVASTAGPIVRVTSRNGSRLFYQAYTRPLARPAGLSKDRIVVFGDAAPGEALPIAAWFPVDSPTGYAFVY